MVNKAFIAILPFCLVVSVVAESYTRVNITLSSSGGECVIEKGFRRSGISTYQLIFTPTSDACCQLCEADPRCKSWDHDRREGACGLKSEVEPLVVGENCDSGVIGGAPVGEEVMVEFPCPVEWGMDRPGNTFREEATASEEACCRVCENTVACYSWSWEVDTGLCHLKNGLPNGRAREGYSSGPVI